VSIRPTIEAALSATADRLDPGSGRDAVHDARNLLMSIDGSSEDFDRRYAGEAVGIAAPLVVEAKHPDGDPVTISKKRDGLIVVFSDSFIEVRKMGFGVTEVNAYRKDDVTAEPITTVVKGSETPGLRVTGRAGKPHLALAIAPGDPAAQAAVRDEIVSALAG
jgi:hypothetical protein